MSKKRTSLLLVLVLFTLPLLSDLPSSQAANSVSKVQSGLVAQDSLTSGGSSYWTLYGNAVERNAPHTYKWNGSGLYLGTATLVTGVWAGYFAKSPNTAAQLFHAVLTIPYSSVSANSIDTGLYVQTSSPVLDYVACVAMATTTGHLWMVVSATGGVYFATQFSVLYRASGGPLTQDCTIVTNGANMLRVYLGGQLVYNSDALNLQMPAPFNSYLEVQTTNSNNMLFGAYRDYYAATSDSVRVTNVAQGDAVKLIDASYNVIASGVPAQNGTVTLPVGVYHMPMYANLEVVDSANTVLASSGYTNLWGGDSYQASLLAISHLTVKAQDASSTPLSGHYVVLSENGKVVATGFSPVSFTVNNGLSYSVEAQDYGSSHFSYWLDTSSTSRDRTISVTANTTIIAVYQSVGNTNGSSSGQSGVT